MKHKTLRLKRAMENNTKRKDHLETLHHGMTILAVVALIGFVISMSMALSMMVGG